MQRNLIVCLNCWFPNDFGICLRLVHFKCPWATILAAATPISKSEDTKEGTTGFILVRTFDYPVFSTFNPVKVRKATV